MDLLLNFLYASIVAATPLLFGTLGEIISEKVGNLNLGVEGMMWLGAFSGFFIAYRTESLLLTLLASFALAAMGAAIYAFLTVTLKANQNVTGLTLTLFGIGLAKVLGTAMTTSLGGKSPITTPAFNEKLAPLHIPFLSDIPVVGKLIFSHSILVYLIVALCLFAYFYFKRTQNGLNIRAIGENPAAADAAGINVSLQKYIHIIIGGGICGIGGAFMSIISTNGSWQAGGVVNGAGWIAVALVIFASWNPARAILGSFVFGMFASLKNYIPAAVIDLPPAIYQMLPFLLTTIVLIITSIKKSRENQQPASCGVNYYREER